MALKRCRECGKPVSTAANVCPHCGVPNPTLPGIRKASSARSRIGVGVLVVLGVLGLISFFDSGSSGEPPSPDSVAASTEADTSSQHEKDVAAMKKQAASELSSQPTTPDCKTDYRVCKDNADLVNNYQDVVKAQGDCKFETDQAVQYGRPDWGGIFDLPFSKYAVGQEAPKTGIVTLIDDHVELQNQFGAMAKSEVVCRYNLRTKVAASLTINGEPVDLPDRASAAERPTLPATHAAATEPDHHAAVAQRGLGDDPSGSFPTQVQGDCRVLVGLTAAAAMWRDNGVPIERARNNITRAIDSGNSRSYMTSAQAQEWLKTVDRIYASHVTEDHISATLSPYCTRNATALPSPSVIWR